MTSNPASVGPAPDGLLSCDPEIMDGELCITGQRIPVRAVKSFADAGYSPAAIRREYPSLSIEQINAAIDHPDREAAPADKADPTPDDVAREEWLAGMAAGGRAEATEGVVEALTNPASQAGMEPVVYVWKDHGLQMMAAAHEPHPRRAEPLYSSKTIRDLEAENARLRSAPIPAVQSGAVDWTEADLEKAAWARWPNGGSSRHANFRQAFRFGAHWSLAPHQSEPLPGGVGEARFVAGPVWKDDETDEHGGDLWTSEVQTMGGYSVIATVHGGSEAEVSARRDAILSALSGKERG